MAVRVNEAAVRLGDVYINAHVGTLRKLGIADDEPMSPLARVNVLVPAFPQLKPKSLSANYGLDVFPTQTSVFTNAQCDTYADSLKTGYPDESRRCLRSYLPFLIILVMSALLIFEWYQYCIINSIRI